MLALCVLLLGFASIAIVRRISWGFLDDSLGLLPGATDFICGR